VIKNGCVMKLDGTIEDGHFILESCLPGEVRRIVQVLVLVFWVFKIMDIDIIECLDNT
jgi:hypothetical protein